MTLGLFAVLSVLLVPLLLGAALLRGQGVVPRTDPLAYLGWAWIQGSLGLAVFLSAWLWCAAPLRAGVLVPAVLGLCALLFALARRVPVVRVPAPSGAGFPRWERVLFALALTLVLASTVDRMLLAANEILATSDEAIIWAAKAKLLFQTGGFGAGFRAELASGEFLSHPDYPPLNPLLQLWVHVHAGAIVHVESRWPIQVFGLAASLVAASALRRRARPGVAALFLVCIGTLGGTRFTMTQVFSDILIATGCLACWDLWQRYEEDGERVWLHLFATTAPLLVWSKNEGLLHVLAFGAALVLLSLVRRRLPARFRLRPVLLWSLPLVASIAYLQWFNAHFGLVNDLVQGGAEIGTEGAPPAGAGFLGLVFDRAGANLGPILTTFWDLIAAQPEQTCFLLLLFLGLAALDPARSLGRARGTFTLGLLFALCGYMVVYLGTHWQIENHLKHSAHRLVYHLLPAAGLAVMLYVVEALPGLAAERVEPAKNP